MQLSIVIEWANTRLNGVPRARALLETIGRQWRAIIAGDYPETLPVDGRRFLDRLDRRADVRIVSGAALGVDREEAIRGWLAPGVEVQFHVAEGGEYYPLKNFGGGLAAGDLLLFVDSDIVPEEGWLAHLLCSFAQPGIDVVCGQTYVAPTNLVARAFALGWMFPLPREDGGVVQPRKLFTNNLAFRAEVFRRTGFPPVGIRSRGAGSDLRIVLDRLGTPAWENPSARVNHAPPSSVRHMIIHALAFGRDHYLRRAERRSVYGLATSLGVAGKRFGGGVRRISRHWRQVGLKRLEVPAALAIIAGYYGCFALGGLLTHASPAAMARRFRI